MRLKGPLYTCSVRTARCKHHSEASERLIDDGYPHTCGVRGHKGRYQDFYFLFTMRTLFVVEMGYGGSLGVTELFRYVPG